MNRKILFVVALLAILGGVAVVAALSPIWSQLSPGLTTDAILPTQLSAVTWNGTKSTDTIQLSTTMNVIPTNQQTVKFYITLKSDATSATPTIESLTGDWTTHLMLLGTTTSAGANAKLLVLPNTLPAGETFYLMAEIASPT